MYKKDIHLGKSSWTDQIQFMAIGSCYNVMPHHGVMYWETTGSAVEDYV